VVIVGRDAELSLAGAFLERASEQFGVAVFEGEAGIGKTTVWREAGRQAAERGFCVLSCRPVELETKLALSAVVDLLEGVPEETFGSLPEPQRWALDVARLRVEPTAGALEPRRVATAFRSLLEALRGAGPVLVAVDDTQWLDPASATVIAFAMRRLSDTPIGWLFARRLGEPAALDADRLVAPESLTRVTLGPLSVAALQHVLRDRAEQRLTRPVLTRIHGACEGNPLYALEIARELSRTGELQGVGSVPVPDDLRRLISSRVRRLPRATADALLACAALSQPTTSLVDERALAEAEEREIVSIDPEGRVAFLHPLYASAVYGSASRARRRELHARLADSVGDVEERARHLALAATEPDEGIASALDDGAAIARARGAWESAAELVEQAAHLTPADRLEDAHRRGIAAAEHHVHAGDRPRARALLEATLAGPLSRGLKAEALRLLAEVSYNDENFAEAGRLFREALEHADEPQPAAAIELGLAYVDSQVWDNLWDFPSGAAHAYRALELAEAVADRALTAEALAYCALMDFLCGKGLDWDKVERSLELEDPDRVVSLERRPSTMAALLLLWVDRISDARERLAAVCTAARERGDESDLALGMVWLSWLETRNGNFATARDFASEAASLASLTGSHSMHAWALALRAYAGAHRGAVAETRRDCAEAAALLEHSGYLMPGMGIAASLGLLEMSLGNPDAAWGACEALVQAVEHQGIGEPVVLWFLPDAVEALIALGELDRAEGVLDAFDGRARELDRTWALAIAGRWRGLLLAARGDLGDATAALDRALAQHERIEMPFERARTLLVKGVVERRTRRRSSAKQCFEHALEIFDRLESPLFAERARDELRRVGLRRSSGELTEGERDVARLAATGLTNREIAVALFISPKTVEANLARAYRKLGIRSRAELGARMSEKVQT
jgi:DNA-binding CsgD family transcriptional regulator